MLFGPDVLVCFLNIEPCQDQRNGAEITRNDYTESSEYSECVTSFWEM